MELIKIKQNSDRPTVSGRELHEKLGIGTPYDKWFPRMCEYGFVEGRDFSTFLSESTGGRPAKNHEITISMAKEICMIQRTRIGKQFREYFLEIEEKWNSPEQIMARALQLAQAKLVEMEQMHEEDVKTLALKEQQIAEIQPKVTYHDVILQCKDLVTVTTIAKDYGMSAKKMNHLLHNLGVQFKQSGIWFLYQVYANMGYTQTKTHYYYDKNGEQHSNVHTYWTQKGRLFLYELLKDNGILPLIEMEDVKHG